MINNNNDNNNDIDNEIILLQLPHQKPIEQLIINMRETIFVILETLINKQNPIPYINSNPDRFLSTSIILIIFGTLLLLLSNLMKS